jgi:hypothetical protein
MNRIIFRSIAKLGVLLMFAVPIGMFIKSSGTFGTFGNARAEVGKWHAIPPPIVLAMPWNAGWAMRDQKPTADEIKLLRLTGALPEPPSPPSSLSPSLTVMPVEGWTLDSGALITTDSNNVLVLRPLTSGRPSLPGQGQGWRAAYWYPERTARWQNYTLRVTISNLGAQGSGANATVVAGYSNTVGGYAVTISAARVTIQNRTGAHIYGGVIPAATAHHVAVTLTDQLSVSIDGSSVATFPVGHVQGGIGLGVWKAAASSNLPFFTHLQVTSSQ